MSDEGMEIIKSDSADHGEMMLYDYMKHISSLSLITLGGILTISQMDQTDDIKPVNLITAVALIGISGGLAFSCTSELATARYRDKPLARGFQLARSAAPIFFLLGVGYALAMFVDVMI